MKLLFDQNLSHHLCAALDDAFPESRQVRLLGLDRASDLEIWRYAAANRFVLVTQDNDFRDLSALYGSPPKVVPLRCGNQPTAEIERLIRTHLGDVQSLEQADEIDVLELA